MYYKRGYQINTNNSNTICFAKDLDHRIMDIKFQGTKIKGIIPLNLKRIFNIKNVSSISEKPGWRREKNTDEVIFSIETMSGLRQDEYMFIFKGWWTCIPKEHFEIWITKETNCKMIKMNVCDETYQYPSYHWDHIQNTWIKEEMI